MTSRRDLTGTMVRSGGNHPQMDLLFHVSEILQLTQICGIFPMGNQSGICGLFVGFLKQAQVCTMVKNRMFNQNKLDHAINPGTIPSYMAGKSPNKMELYSWENHRTN